MYEDDNKYKVYLLNTDTNVEQKVYVKLGDEPVGKTIPSCELNFVEFLK